MEMPGSAAASTLSIDVDVTGGAVVMHPRGEIDVVTAPEFQEAVERTAAQHPDVALIVDLSKVAFLASAGLAVLVRCSDDLADQRRFIVVAHGPTTLRPLELTGLTETLEVHSSVEAALATV
ncbi:anti-sigma-factor antagonist [Rhodococcus sp. OK519]|uniref:STAS domain-containing protein n=1 Tax=Rhodococcus sp. OK519 TaxID=2135729 RepID=UPI000D37E886|nr:anti-sigma-factor antagonist [Rhodococcus sp. OK519]